MNKEIQTALAPVALPMSDLGYSNGWKEAPAIRQKCRTLGHQTSEKTIGRCLREISCSLCNYKFKVDSGG